MNQEEIFNFYYNYMLSISHKKTYDHLSVFYCATNRSALYRKFRFINCTELLLEEEDLNFNIMKLLGYLCK